MSKGASLLLHYPGDGRYFRVQGFVVRGLFQRLLMVGIVHTMYSSWE